MYCQFVHLLVSFLFQMISDVKSILCDAIKKEVKEENPKQISTINTTKKVAVRIAPFQRCF